ASPGFWSRGAVTATPGRLHGLVDRGQQLVREAVQGDVVTQGGGEGLDGPGRVVAAAVEAAVDRGLDAAAGRLEQGGHGQGGPGHGPTGRAVAEPAGQ